MSKTPRDEIYTVLHETDSIRITISSIQEQAEEDLSKYTIRHTLNGLTETGVLKHKTNSPYWYIV